MCKNHSGSFFKDSDDIVILCILKLELIYKLVKTCDLILEKCKQGIITQRSKEEEVKKILLSQSKIQEKNKEISWPSLGETTNSEYLRKFFLE